MSFAALLLALQSAGAESAPPAPPPPACASEEHAALDFWVGEWEVYNATNDAKVAESSIERVAGGCVIRETWMPLRGSGGTSMSMINHRTGRWQQVWVGGNGTRVDFEGGPVAGEMVLTGYWDDLGGPGVHGLVRMTYTGNPDGSVRQYGEGSTDHGKTWQSSFDLIYRPKEDAK